MVDKIFADATGKLVLRLSVGLLMMFHGIAKILHPENLGFIESSLTNVGLPSELAYAVYLGEVIAPLMLIAGYQARIGGFIILVNMIFAVGLAHMGDFLSLTQHGGWALELQAFYLLGSLSIMLLGSGRYAIRPD